MKRNPVITACALATVAFLYLPILAVAVFSVNATRYGLTWSGFTLDWYARLFRNEFILEAAWNTVVLAVLSTAVSTVIGTVMAIGMDKFPWTRRFSTFLDVVLHLPVVIPDIILAVALVLIFSLLRLLWSVFEPGLFTMALAHITFQIAFVALVVRARLVALGRDIEEAAHDLYAGAGYVLRKITLPLLMPGIAAGAMLAFTLSLDDFIISFFTAGPDSVTLPLFIYAAVRRGVTPEIHALSTLVMLLTVLIVVVSERFTRRI